MDWSVCYERCSSNARLLPPRGPRRWLPVARLGAAVSLQQQAAAAATRAAGATAAGGEAVLRLAFSPCGSLLAACTSWGGLSVWDVESGTPLLQLPLLLPAAAAAVAWHCSGAYLWLGCTDGSLLLLPLRAYPLSPSLLSPRGLYVAAYKGAHTGGVLGVAAVDAAAAADAGAAARLVWTGGADGFIRLWDLRQQRSACAEVYGHAAAAAAVAAAPDGSAVASAGGDGLMRLWAGASLRLLKTTDGVGGAPLSSVAWSPGGAHILCTRGSSSSSSEPAAAAVAAAAAAVAVDTQQQQHQQQHQQQQAVPDAKIWNLRCMGLAAAANAAAASFGGDCCQQQEQQEPLAGGAAEAAGEETLDWGSLEKPFVNLFAPRPTPEARLICDETQRQLLQQAAAAHAAAAAPAAVAGDVAAAAKPLVQQKQQQQQGSQQQASTSDPPEDDRAAESAAAAAARPAAAAAEDMWGQLLPCGAFWRDRVLLPAGIGCCCCFAAVTGDIEQLLLRPCCCCTQQQQQQQVQRGVVAVHPDWDIGVAATSFVGDGCCIYLWCVSAALEQQRDQGTDAQLRILKAANATGR